VAPWLIVSTGWPAALTGAAGVMAGSATRALYPVLATALMLTVTGVALLRRLTRRRARRRSTS
jgi:hypothetical protein